MVRRRAHASHIFTYSPVEERNDLSIVLNVIIIDVCSDSPDMYVMLDRLYATLCPAMPCRIQYKLSVALFVMGPVVQEQCPP